MCVSIFSTTLAWNIFILRIIQRDIVINVHSIQVKYLLFLLEFNPLTPNESYRGRTATLTSKRCILYFYSTNIGTEYFKHCITLRLFLFKMQFVSQF